MATVTVSLDLLQNLGVRLTGVQELNADIKRTLEPLLASRGFNVRDAIHVSELARDQGFLLTQ